MKYKYGNVNIEDMDEMNELGKEGYRFVGIFEGELGKYALMEKKVQNK